MTRTVLRSLSVAFALSTAAYALLSASPFTFHDFVRSNMFGIAGFARWHALLYWAWLAVAAVDVCLAAAGRRAVYAPFLAAWTALGLLNALHPILPGLVD